MSKSGHIGLVVGAAVMMFGGACSRAPHISSSTGAIAAGNMQPIGTGDDRFQSYNIEMVEVTGGRFWKPYKDVGALLKTQGTIKGSGSNQPPA